MTSRDPFGPDDPTPATAPGDASTPPQGMPILPDWEDGFVHGRQRGIADTADALRRALLLVGVPFSDVELIVLRVRGLIR